MIDDFYQAALAALRHHLNEAGAEYTLDDGEILVGGHRLGLSIAFEGFVPQGAHTLAPLEVQIHVDGDTGDRFRVGALGIGPDQTTALREAISEWHLLVVAPLLAALGAPVETRRGKSQLQRRVAGWDLFAGRAGIRGRVPPELRASDAFFRSLLECLRQVVETWERPNRFELHSVYFMATRGPDVCDIQAAIDGILEAKLVELLSELPWPRGDETYLYKQLFVLRSQPTD